MPLGVSALDNKDLRTVSESSSIDAHREHFAAAPIGTYKRAMARVFCDSAQFYAGNERSTSLVTAIPVEADQHNSAELKDTASVLLKKVLMGRQFMGPELMEETETTSIESMLTPSIIDDAERLTLQDLVSSSPTLGLKLLALRNAKASPHVHFASPLSIVNTYTPEFDANSGSTGSSSSASASYVKNLPLSPPFFSLNQAMADLEKELAEMETSPEILSSPQSADILPNHNGPYETTVQEKVPLILNDAIRSATRGIPQEIIDNYNELMLDLSANIERINIAMEQYAMKSFAEFPALSPVPNTRRRNVTKKGEKESILADKNPSERCDCQSKVQT